MDNSHNGFNGAMMTKQNVNILGWVVIAVLVTMLLTSLFRKSAPNEDAIRAEMEAKHKEEMRVKDSVYYTRVIASQDITIAALLQRTTEKQIQYVQLKTDYGKIRPTVESYSNSELLRRANAWSPVE